VLTLLTAVGRLSIDASEDDVEVEEDVAIRSIS
jgi:hypothetical protein